MNIRQATVLILTLALVAPVRVNADLGSLLKNVTSAVSDAADVVSDAAGAVSDAVGGKAQTGKKDVVKDDVDLDEDDLDENDLEADDEAEEPAKQENPFSNFGGKRTKSDSSQSFGDKTDSGAVWVEASGFGETVALAKMAAGRAAIEQVVGQMVDAETLVENDELIKDKILQYSGGYLKDIEVIGKPETSEDGIVTVKVKALVQKTQLAKKLETERITKTKVSGGKLFANVVSRQQEAADAAAILEPEFAKFPYKLVKTKLGKKADGSPALKVNAKDGTVIARVELSVDKEAYKEWAKGLKAKLDKIATDCKTHQAQVTKLPDKSGRYKNTFDKDLMPDFSVNGMRYYNDAIDLLAGTKYMQRSDLSNFTSEKEVHIYLVTSTRDNPTAVQIFDYTFTGDKVDNIKKLLLRYGNIYSCEFSASLVTEDGDLIATGKTETTRIGGCVLYNANRNQRYTATRGCFIAPWWMNGHYGQLEFAMPKFAFVDFGKVATEDLADVTDCATSVKFLVHKGSGTADIADGVADE